MALQAASLVSSAFSVRKEGKSNASSSTSSSSFKESSLFGDTLSDQIKADFVSSSLRCQREQSLRNKGAIIRAQTIATSTPSVTQSTLNRKKTRESPEVVAGATVSSDLVQPVTTANPLRPPSRSSRRDESVATRIAAIGAQTKPYAPSKVSPEIVSATTGSPLRRRRKSSPPLATAVLRRRPPSYSADAPPTLRRAPTLRRRRR
ncbi:Uncharacterized protein Rs2_49981 [Raphanus sativus]|nr:Uncharacterized protein Rs2_49981 [Raphanus sativus]